MLKFGLVMTLLVITGSCQYEFINAWLAVDALAGANFYFGIDFATDSITLLGLSATNMSFEALQIFAGTPFLLMMRVAECVSWTWKIGYISLFCFVLTLQRLSISMQLLLNNIQPRCWYHCHCWYRAERIYVTSSLDFICTAWSLDTNSWWRMPRKQHRFVSYPRLLDSSNLVCMLQRSKRMVQ